MRKEKKLNILYRWGGVNVKEDEVIRKDRVLSRLGDIIVDLRKRMDNCRTNEESEGLKTVNKNLFKYV